MRPRNWSPPRPRRLLAVLLLVFLGLALLPHAGPARGSAAPAAHPAPADLGASALPVGQAGGVSRAFVAQGNVLWAGVGPRVIAIDARDVTAMRVMSRSRWLDSLVIGLAVEGNLAVAATESGQLYVLDVADPDRPGTIAAVRVSPQPPGTTPAVYRAHAPVTLARGFAYTIWNTGDEWGSVTASGVAVVDLRTPDAPKVVSTSLLPPSTRATDLAVVGGVLAVACFDGDLRDLKKDAVALRLYDLHDPSAPAITATVTDPAWLRLGVGTWVDGRPALFGYGWGGVALDTADPSRPRVLARYGDAGYEDFYRLARIIVLPSARLLVARPGGYGEGVLVELMRPPVDEDTFGPQHSLAHWPGDPEGGVARLGERVVVATTGGRLLVFDTDFVPGQPNKPIAGLDLLGAVESVALDHDAGPLYLISASGGLAALDLAGQPADPVLVGRTWDDSFHGGLAVSDGKAVVARVGQYDTVDRACDVFDVQDAASLRFLARVDQNMRTRGPLLRLIAVLTVNARSRV